MKIIILKNKIIKLDDCDAYLLTKHKFHIVSKGNNHYLRCNIVLNNKKRSSTYIHRLIMNAKYDEVVDHIDFNGVNFIDDGGCDAMQHVRDVILINDDGEIMDKLIVVSLKSSNNNCGIACFTNSLKVKTQPNKLRGKLGLELGKNINIYDDMDKLIDHFNCDVQI